MAQVNPGLEGVLAAETTISLVDGSAGRLLYRGYEIGDLASHGTFDSVTALLLDGRVLIAGGMPPGGNAGVDPALRSAELFAQYVMPKFQGQLDAPAAHRVEHHE